MFGNANKDHRRGGWVSDLSLSRKLSFLIWIYLVVIVILLSASVFSLRALSANRAFVNAEGLWSKAQKEATFHLTLYLLQGNPVDYSAFQDLMSVHQGFRDAIAEMDRPAPDLSRVARGFVRGGMTLDDASEMAWLFNRFRHLEYTERALEAWREGDRLILEFGATAEDQERKKRLKA